MQIDVTTTASRWSATMRETTERKRTTSLLLGDQIADASQCVDLHSSSGMGQLLAQPVHIDFDRVRPGFLRQPIEIVCQHRLRDDASTAAQQKFEDSDLARRKEYRLIPDKGLAGRRIEGDVAELQSHTEKIARSPQQRLQPCDEFLEGKGLDEVIVGTALQAGDSVFHAAARGQDQHRGRISATAHLVQVFFFKQKTAYEIEHDNVETIDPQCRDGFL